MDKAQSDEIKPTDPDMKWTGWALDSLRHLVEIDIRTKRMTERQQETTRMASESMPDFDLKQSRLSRSVRLSIAMTERIRAQYLMRKTRRKESGEQERRRQRREQAADAVVQALAVPDEIRDVERRMVRETLVEDEILDAQLDTLSPEEFVREVCRKIGRPPPSIPLPQGWDDIAETKAALTAETVERAPMEVWPRVPDKSAAGRLTLKPSKPDSS
jgi:nucleoside-diphosphate-sugar epimerase